MKQKKAKKGKPAKAWGVKKRGRILAIAWVNKDDIEYYPIEGETIVRVEVREV